MAGPSVGHISVSVDANTGQLKAQLVKAGEEAGRAAKAAIESELRGIEANVAVDVGSASLDEAKARIEHALDGIDANVNVDINQASLAAARAQLEAGGDGGGWGGAGRTAGDDFGGGFADALSSPGRAKTLALFAENIGTGLQGSLAALTSVASSAFSALAGGAGAATGILAGLGGVLGSIVVGSQGMVDAFGAINDEFKAAAVEGRDFNLAARDIQDAFAVLSPAAQDFATAFAEVLPQLHAIQEEVSGRLFAGLDDELRELSTTAIPSIGEALELAADSANRFFTGLSDVLQGIDFAGIFEALQPAVDAVGDAVLALIEAIEPFLTAAAPAAQVLADAFAAGAVALGDMIAAGAESGALTDFFLEGVDSLLAWGGLLRDVGDLLFTIFQAGKASGDDFVTTLSGIIQQFDGWLESVEGQTALADFFATGQRVIGALGPVLEGLQGFFENLITPEAVGRFEDLATAIGDVLPILGDVLAGVGRVTGLVVDALQPLIDLINLIPDDLIVLGAAFVTFGSIASGVLNAITGLATVAAARVAAINPLIAGVVIGGALADIVGKKIDPAAHSVFSTEYWTDDLPNAIKEGIFKGKIITEDFWTQGIGGTADPAMVNIRTVTGGLNQLSGATIAQINEMERLRREAEEPIIPAGLGELSEATLTAIERMEDLRASVETVAPSTDQLMSSLGGFATMFASAVDPAAALAQEFSNLQGEAIEAATAADTLRTSLDLLIRPELAAQAASDALAGNLVDLTDALNGGAEAQRLRDEAARLAAAGDQAGADAALAAADAIEQQSEALGRNTEAGRAARAQLRTNVEGLLTFAETQLAAGASSDVVERKLGNQRQALIDTAVAAGASRQEVRDLINQYGLTPDAIRTLVEQPGMTDAQTRTGNLQGALDGLEANPYIPTVNLADNATPGVGNIQGDVDALGATLAIPTINLADNASEGLGNIGGLMTQLDGRVSTVTVEQVTVSRGATSTPAFGAPDSGQFGGIVPLGAFWLAGEAGPEFIRMPGGQRALATMPTLVPGGTVITSAAMTRAMLDSRVERRPMDEEASVIERQFNVTQNFALANADPAAVAVQAINRMTALVR